MECRIRRAQRIYLHLRRPNFTEAEVLLSGECGHRITDGYRLTQRVPSYRGSVINSNHSVLKTQYPTSPVTRQRISNMSIPTTCRAAVVENEGPEFFIKIADVKVPEPSES